jgi:hypothetical protein
MGNLREIVNMGIFYGPPYVNMGNIMAFLTKISHKKGKEK